MRKIILGLAVSLDGYIEGRNGEIDWCFTDQDYGMSEFLNRVDTLFMGRKSYELTLGVAGGTGFPKLKEYIFTNSLKTVKKGIEIIGGDIETQVLRIKNQTGKDIWLFGGAELITSLINMDFVDEVWLSIHPVILGEGKPLFKNIKKRIQLKMIDTKSYSTGLVSCRYLIEH